MPISIQILQWGLEIGMSTVFINQSLETCINNNNEKRLGTVYNYIPQTPANYYQHVHVPENGGTQNGMDRSTHMNPVSLTHARFASMPKALMAMNSFYCSVTVILFHPQSYKFPVLPISPAPRQQ